MTSHLRFAPILALVMTLGSIAEARSDDISPEAADLVPEMACAQPDPPPRVEPKQRDIERFNHAMGDYTKCINEYVAARQKLVTYHQGVARKNLDAANATIATYNAFTQKLNALSNKDD